jgi:hypothetical protein
MEGVWTCVKGTPFSSGLKNTVSNVAQLRSEHVMLGVDDGGSIMGSALPGRMSPPLFPRNADSQRRGSHRVHPEVNGIEALKGALKPDLMDIDGETQEKEDIMEKMRVAEGWRECQPEALSTFSDFFLRRSVHPTRLGTVLYPTNDSRQRHRGRRRGCASNR